MQKSLIAIALFATLATAGCQPEADAPVGPVADATATPTSDAAPASADAMPAPATDAQPVPATVDARATLAGQVWRVERSDAVEVGSTYAFLEDGALVIDSPNGTPLTGSWAVSDDGKLSMTEEGSTYPTDLVVHDAEHITLRSHNPGGVVEMALVRAPDVPLPTPADATS